MRPPPTLSWLELLAIAAIVVAWSWFRRATRPPWSHRPEPSYRERLRRREERRRPKK